MKFIQESRLRKSLFYFTIIIKYYNREITTRSCTIKDQLKKVLNTSLMTIACLVFVHEVIENLRRSHGFLCQDWIHLVVSSNITGWSLTLLQFLILEFVNIVKMKSIVTLVMVASLSARA